MRGWQKIDAVTDALLVPGGMVLRTRDGDENGNGIAVAVAMVFVPNTGEDTCEELASWVKARNRNA